MTRGLNKVLLLGHLGADPERTESRDGRPSVKLRLATNHTSIEPGGARKEVTEWHSVRAFGPVADVCHQYLRKGRQVFVEGRLHTWSWEDDKKQRHTRTEIVAAEVRFLDGGRGADGEAPRGRLEEVA